MINCYSYFCCEAVQAMNYTEAMASVAPGLGLDAPSEAFHRH